MSYTPANLAQIVNGGIGAGAPALWTHHSTDAAATVRVTGFITDGGDRGMKVGDILFHTQDTTVPIVSTMLVISVSATSPGAVDLSDAVAVTGAANTD